MRSFLFFSIPSLPFPISSRSWLSKVPPMRSAASSVGAGWWGTWRSSQGQFSPSTDHPAHTVSKRHSHLDGDQRNRFVPRFPFSALVCRLPVSLLCVRETARMHMAGTDGNSDYSWCIFLSRCFSRHTWSLCTRNSRREVSIIALRILSHRKSALQRER